MMRTMRRAVTILMGVLLVVTLFMGNCLSCPQVLLALSNHQPAHSCCPKTGKEEPACQSAGLQAYVAPDSAPHAAPQLAVLGNTVEPPASETAVAAGFTPAEPAVHPPPDLLSLHSSFRI